MGGKIKNCAAPRVARVLIVDDHPVVRDGLTWRIGRHPDLTVCGAVDDVASALEVIDKTPVDVAIIDISLKHGSGIDLIKRVKARNDTIRMIVLSMHDENLYAERALRAGAMGYVNKEHATDQIIAAIHSVLEGKVYLKDSLVASLLGRLCQNGAGEPKPSPIQLLSDRELQVFELIGAGLDTAQVADNMHVSAKTVETYRARIKEKLNLNRGVDLLRYAVQWALEAQLPDKD